MRMFQHRNDARLLMEARREFLALRQLARQNFDRDITIYRGLIGFVDVCHSPFANLINDAIRSEHLSGLNVIHGCFLFDVLPILRLFHFNFKDFLNNRIGDAIAMNLWYTFAPSPKRAHTLGIVLRLLTQPDER
jgi:hypothetical protein